VNNVSSSHGATRTIVSIFVVVAVAIAFWALLLGPKRDKASSLGSEVAAAQASLAQAVSAASEATAAQQEFAPDYRRLVSLGKAVPAGEETPSLLVVLSRIAKRTGVAFDSLQLTSEAGEGAATSTSQEAGPTTSIPTSSTVPPTEAEAALLPLGATVGNAGLGVMPYSLIFAGGYFEIAKFIHEIDGLIRTEKNTVEVDGRLITIDGFSLSEETGASGILKANVAVTTYLVPPAQGITAGATTEAPAPVSAEPGATEETATGTPSAYPTGSEASAR
jgi:Tfp pilus assembly protein PilO